MVDGSSISEVPTIYPVIVLGQKLEVLMEDLRQALRSDPPLPGSFTPRKNELCAARFSADGQWYRAKVESLQRNNKASVLYIDYGNVSYS